MKVGIGTSSAGSSAIARIRARAKVVLPAPRSPVSAMTSPDWSRAATSSANAIVAPSSGRSTESAGSFIERRLFGRDRSGDRMKGEAADDAQALSFFRIDLDACRRAARRSSSRWTGRGRRRRVRRRAAGWRSGRRPSSTKSPGMPGPLVGDAEFDAVVRRVSPSTITRPPGAEKATALARRLKRIWRTRRSSATKRPMFAGDVGFDGDVALLQAIAERPRSRRRPSRRRRPRRGRVP